MKKTLILTVACLLIFGSLFTTFTLYSDEQTPAEKWGTAEKALKSANDSMGRLDTKRQALRAEFTELANNAISAAVTMWNPIDAIKTLWLM